MTQEVKGMTCPVDGATLAMMDRQGIEVDYCPECRGVWLDRGEVDKLIERAAAYEPDYARAAPRGARDEREEEPSGQRRRSFLGGVFGGGRC